MDKKKKAVSGRSKILEYIKAIIMALLIALVINTFCVKAYKIPTGSMIPTLLIGDHLFVNKIIYGTPIDIPFTNITLFYMPGFSQPQKGDIIVFKSPEDPTKDFIKRVVATEGDTIQMISKKVYINGRSVSEPYVQYIDHSIKLGHFEPRDDFGPYLVPKGKLFMMGDNRDNSSDSRVWGYVDVKQVKGKALIMYWSWDSDNSKPRLGRIGKLIN
jgi:signal peptidase I